VSSLVGSPHDRLSLARAVDALADAARRAGRPGPVWLVGVLYPGLNLNVDLVRTVLALIEELSGLRLPGAGDVGPIVTLFAPNLELVTPFDSGAASIGPVVLLLFLLVFRPVVGLARLSDPARGAARPPTLREVWREGKGLALVAFGLWAMLLALLFAAMLVLIGPVVALMKMPGLGTFARVFAALLLPALVLILTYAAVLMVLNQLALHSLAHNQRGAASALTHAWRLVRADPMGALRASVVDFVLFVTVMAIVRVAGVVLPSLLEDLLALALYGFVGVARAGYWARAYRALGGLSPADGVPGL
jgi:hypothetical protein